MRSPRTRACLGPDIVLQKLLYWTPSQSLQDYTQLAPINTLLRQVGVIRHHRVRLHHVRIIIHPPKRLPDLAGRVEQPRPHIIHHQSGSNCHANRLNRLNYAIDHVRGLLVGVGQNKVKAVEHGVLEPQADDAEGNMLDNGGCCLPVHLIPID